MPTPIVITDPDTGRTVGMSTSHALAVGPAKPSTSFNATFGVDDTPVEIVPGKCEAFCITGIILTGNKNISTSVDATVTIYQATADDLTTSLADILIVPIARSSQTALTNILLEVPAGYYIMGKTSDDDVLATILGFYV